MKKLFLLEPEAHVKKAPYWNMVISSLSSKNKQRMHFHQSASIRRLGSDVHLGILSYA